MTTGFEDILRALCRDVALLNANDSQYSFTLSTAREAQLAYDVLAAYGFDVRVYHENNASKLYVARTAAPETMQKLDAALVHAEQLAHMLDSMDGWDENAYKISFSNTPSQGKQISIYFQPTVVDLPPAAAPAETVRRPAPTRAMARGRKKHDLARRTPPASMVALGTSGTELARQYPFGIVPGQQKVEEDGKPSFGKLISTYIFSNFSESLYAFFVMFFLSLVFLSAVIVMRGFYCPDLATVKSTVWYCNLGKQEDEKQ